MDGVKRKQQHAGRDPDKQYGGLTYGFLQENFSQLLLDMHLAAKRVAKIVKDLKNFARQRCRQKDHTGKHCRRKCCAFVTDKLEEIRCPSRA